MSATGGAPRTSSSGAKSRPTRDAHAQHAKKVGVDAARTAARSGCSSAMSHVAGAARRRHRLERRRRRVPHLHVELVDHRLGLARTEPGARHQQPDRDEAIGIRVRQRPEEHAVERGEERRRGAEAECQHEDGRQRERRAAAATSAR